MVMEHRYIFLQTYLDTCGFNNQKKKNHQNCFKNKDVWRTSETRITLRSIFHILKNIKHLEFQYQLFTFSNTNIKPVSTNPNQRKKVKKRKEKKKKQHT